MRLYHTIAYYSGKFRSYHISTYAASASFFIITALIPVFMLVLSILSFTPLGTQDFLNILYSLTPESFHPLLAYIPADLLDSSATTLSISAVATLWTASKSMLGLMDGLNAIEDVNDTRNFIFKRIICIGYMLMLIGTLLFTLVLRVFGQHILSFLTPLAPRIAAVFARIMAIRGLTLFFISAFVIMLIYTVFPNKRMRFYATVPGALFTSAAWIVFTELFSIYARYSSTFSVLYGSLGLVILATLWLYFCLSIIFIGAVINRMYPSIFWRTYVVLKYRRRLVTNQQEKDHEDK